MRKRMTAVLGAMVCALAAGTAAQAAVADNAVSQAYNAAVRLEDQLDGFSVTVKGTVSIAGQPAGAEKTIQIRANGMQSEGKLQASIDIQTPEGSKQQYFRDGCFYSNQTGSNRKYAMDQEIMKELLNYYVYLDFDSEYLSMLDGTTNADGTASYSFAASQKTVGSYADKLLEGAQEEHRIDIVSLQGTVDTDQNGIITERSIEMAYTVKSGDQPQLCILNSHAVFDRTGAVSVSFPDLSSYSEKEQNEPAVKITQESRTLYATDDLNVRAQNNVTAAVLGGIPMGESMQETCYTDDGWIQISYNGATAYVSGNYVSSTKPVIVKAMSGDMYAVAQVNVRDAYSTDSKVLGVLSAGEAVSTTGYTDNNWIEVKYGGQTGYVYADYLTWEAPAVKKNNTFSGYLEGYVRDATTNGLSLETSNGSEYYFYTGNAYKNTVDGLVIGDWIGVYYTFDGSGYIASEVDDYNNHNYNYNYDSGNVMNDNNYGGGYQDMESYGTVIAYGMSAVTVALDNGLTLSADKDYVSIYGNLYEGAYVLVDYIGDYMYEITQI